MAASRLWGRVSIVVSVVAGAMLILLLVTGKPEPMRQEAPKPEVTAPKPAETETPEPQVAMLEVTLPPPPAPAPSEPEIEAEAPRPVESKPEPLPEPMQEAPQPPPEQIEAEAPEPEPAIEVTPLRPRAPETLPETKVIQPLQHAEPVPEEPQEPVVEPQPIEPLRPREPEEMVAEEPETLEPEPVAELAPLQPQKTEPVRPKVAPEPPAPPPAAPEVEFDPVPEPPRTVQVSVRSSGAQAAEGRTLLRLLEHGSGPDIEIAWPQSPRERYRLQQQLSSCFGMRTALMNARGDLFVAEGARGQKWNPNLDRFSGFVRRPNGYLSPKERDEAERIRQYHRLGRTERVIRLFPRHVDSVLLGGLRQVLGASYDQARTIRAAYRLDGTTLTIEDIRADGVLLPGRIAFGDGLLGGCRTAMR